MPISFGCPHCGRRFEVPDHLEGKRARCQTCGHVVSIVREAIPILDPLMEAYSDLPAGPASLAEYFTDDQFAASGPLLGSHPGRSRRREVHPAVIAGIAAGAAIVLGAIVIMAVSWASQDAPSVNENRRTPPRLGGKMPANANPARPGSNAGPSEPIVPNRPSSTWALVPEPGPSLPQGQAIDVGDKAVRHALFAREVPRVVVEQVDRRTMPEKHQGTLCDTETGRPLGSFPLPEYSTILALSPDGSTMAVASTDFSRRPDILTLWAWQQGTARLIQSIRVSKRDSDLVKWACFVSPTDLLIRMNGREVRLLDLTARQQRYSFEGPSSQSPAVSPGGRWLANYVENSDPRRCQVDFHDSQSGAIVATLKPNYDELTTFAASSFSPDGRRFVLLLADYGQRRYVGLCWDLESGRMQSEFWPPFLRSDAFEHPPLWWCGTDYLLIEDRLCHVGRGLYVRRYSPSAVGQVSMDRLWVPVNDLGRNFLVPTQIPLPTDREEIEQQLAKVRPVLRVGDTVRVEIHGAQSAPSRVFQNDLLNAFERRLKEKGYRLADDSGMCFRLSISETTEGEPVQFSSIDRTNVLSVPNRVLHLKMELVDSHAVVQQQWEDSYSISTWPHERPRKDAVTQILNERWDSIIWRMKRREFPRVIYASSVESVFGTTEINAATLRPESPGIVRESASEPQESETGATPAFVGPAWTYQPDQAPSPTSEFVSKQLKLSEGRLFDARFAGPEVGQVAVLMQAISKDGQLDSMRSVERVDLTHSKVLGSFEVPDNAQLLDCRVRMLQPTVFRAVLSTAKGNASLPYCGSPLERLYLCGISNNRSSFGAFLP